MREATQDPLSRLAQVLNAGDVLPTDQLEPLQTLANNLSEIVALVNHHLGETVDPPLYAPLQEKTQAAVAKEANKVASQLKADWQPIFNELGASGLKEVAKLRGASRETGKAVLRMGKQVRLEMPKT